MTEPHWRKLKDPNSFTIKARPEDGLWTKVLDYINGPRKLRFKAEGEWNFAGGTCKPGGSLMLADKSFLPTVPVGALICKIGGGSSDGPPPTALALTIPFPPGAFFFFAVGNFLTMEIPDGVKGALFATMNNQLTGFADHAGEVKLTIEEAL